MGHDKRSLVLDGRTLVERNLDVLRSVFPSLAVALRKGQKLEPQPLADVELVFDQSPESPLAGIVASLERFAAPVFVMAVDLVAPQPAAIRRVVEAFIEVDVALPGFDDHVEPLHAVYGPGCLPVAQTLLARGEHSILELFPRVRVALVDFESEEPFFNINTPRDWEQARRHLRGESRLEG